jgi:dolichol-phosphate mannosyltransferase
MDQLKEMAKDDERLFVVWAPENRSVVDAYFRGYREALANGSDWILEMDGGLSHLPEEIPRFIAAMNRGADFAAGSRFVKGGSYHGRITRHVVSRGGSQLANLLLGTRMKDMTSGFQCFTAKAMTHVLEQGVKSRGHFFQTEIRYMLRNWNWEEVPITYANPSPSLGASSLLEAFRNLWELRKTRKREGR